jgi:hypothetical protein
MVTEIEILKKLRKIRTYLIDTNNYLFNLAEEIEYKDFQLEEYVENEYDLNYLVGEYEEAIRKLHSHKKFKQTDSYKELFENE